MRTFIVAALLLLPVIALAAGTVWVCPMPQHPQQFDKPGTCPVCGMQLVEKNKQLQVAVLVFDYVEDIDFAAPYEVFGESGARLFTVSTSTAPIHTVFGMRLTPEFDLQHAPAADVVLVPGGGVGDTAKNEKVLQWLRDRAQTSKYVLSVCNGAFILANAGLLDGLSATTTASRIEQLATNFPKVHVVRERFVDNGKIITSGGLSAGIDGAFHLLEREYGRARAEDVARHMEYRWQPESKWSRAQYADMRLPDVHLPDNASWETLDSNGDAQQWKLHGRLHIGMPAEEFLDYSTKQIVAKGWTLRSSDKGTRTYARTDRDGQTWVATYSTSVDTEPSAFLETMTIAKQ